ncbi:leucocin A/sakacin P family class II bacteriocin [Ligilactobacillus animalis]|uniref:leucocin A/sakacin P family class II bacteriocin n=1 Tax=Ligilactobacillus animalis TaxID=1605 RepID=UPI00209FD5D9|nr:leucocin A/sakacin P family class II bacteriocin [Ligilactobacillus animalis]
MKQILLGLATVIAFIFVAGGNSVSANTTANVPMTGGGSKVPETYYGNGLYCSQLGCRTDWSRAWYCSVNRAGASYGTFGKVGNIGPC